MAFGLIGGNNLSAAVTACPTTPTTLNVLIASFDTLANACASLDKLFWNFGYTPTGPLTPAATQVTADIIQNPNIDGWNFSGVWLGIGSFTAGFSLSYSIEVCPAALTQPPPTLPCTGPFNPGLRIVQADAVYAPSSVFPRARTQLGTARAQYDIFVFPAQYEHAIAIVGGKPRGGFSCSVGSSADSGEAKRLRHPCAIVTTPA
jgi:hypothetical protein